MKSGFRADSFVMGIGQMGGKIDSNGKLSSAEQQQGTKDLASTNRFENASWSHQGPSKGLLML